MSNDIPMRRWSNGQPQAPAGSVSPYISRGVPSRGIPPPLMGIGKMTAIEREYAEYLESRKAIGEILDWNFKPIRFHLTGLCYYEPSFRVTSSDGKIHFDDVKTRFSPSDNARLQIARRLHPCEFEQIIQRGGRWIPNKSAENT